MPWIEDSKSMNAVPLEAQDLARRLIAQEPAEDHGSEIGFSPALRAIEKLRFPLTRVSGAAGFRSLLSRALALAKVYTPSLNRLSIDLDGTIRVAGDPASGQGAGEAEEEEVALLAELIGLLIIFIGEPLTVQLVRTAWPNAILASINVEQKEPLQ